MTCSSSSSKDNHQEQATFNLIIDRDAYAEHVDFNTLKLPNIQSVIEHSLLNHTDWKGIQDILESAKKEDTDKLKQASYWEPFIKKEIELVKSCITQKVTKLKDMQKELVKVERKHIYQFANDKYMPFVVLAGDHQESYKDQLLIGKWKGLLQVLARTVIDLVKHDMCSGVASSLLDIKEVVSNAFVVEDSVMLESFNNLRAGEALKESLYYISGWHLTACLKAGKRMTRKKEIIPGSLGARLMELFENHTLEKDSDQLVDLPTAKVTRSEMFGGLQVCTSAYFHFILRLEYVFVKLLSPSNLAVLGKELIQQIYEFSKNKCLSASTTILKMRLY